MIKNYMRENLQDKKLLKMFLDIHAHSTKRSIFVYAPKPEKRYEVARTRTFPGILDEMSDVFNLRNCDFNNTKAKENCARLGIYNLYKLQDSYTVETSCYGFEVKNNFRLR